MSAEVWFVIEKYGGSVSPAVFYDPAPALLNRPSVTYKLRLDDKPNAALLLKEPVDKLFALYLHLQHVGKLPPSQ